MPRALRIEYPGAYYHVVARGDRGEKIFVDDDDRRYFLEVLSEACGMTGWRVHAWVLMANHYHLMVETPEANLVAGMQWLQNAYTRRFNTRHRAWGRLFGDRYKSVLVEGRDGYYYETLMDYIHLNPVRAGLVRTRAGQSVLDYPWSSVAGGYALLPRRRPKWLAAERAFEMFGLADTTRGRRQWVERLDRRAREETAKRCGLVELPDGADRRESHLRRGWYWGSQAFAAKLLKQGKRTSAPTRNRKYRTGSDEKAHDQARAKELLVEGMKAAGLAPKEALALPGTDSRKVAIAHVIWENTTVGQRWIAERLGMKSAANVSQILRRGVVEGSLQKLPVSLREWINLSRKDA